MTIDGDISPAAAGGSRTFTCVASVVEGLIVKANVAWMYSDGNVINTGGNIAVGIPEVIGNTSTLTLTISPLSTSHGGVYVCFASITIEEINIQDLSSATEVVVNVTSKP